MRGSVAVFLVLLVGGCVHDSWSVVETSTANAFANTRFDYKRITGEVDYHRRVLAMMLMGGREPERADVFVFDQVKEMEAEPGRYYLGIRSLEAAPVGYSGNFDRAIVGRIDAPGGFGKDGVIAIWPEAHTFVVAHSVMHHFLLQVAPKAPPWFHEGLAGFFSSGSRVPDAQGNLSVCLGYGLVAGPLMPLSELLGRSYEQVRDEPSDAFTLSAVVLVDHLITGEKGTFAQRLIPLIDQFAEGRPANEVLAALYPERAGPELQRAYDAHGKLLGSGRRRGCALRVPLPVPPPPPSSVRPAPADLSAVRTAVLNMVSKARHADWVQ